MNDTLDTATDAQLTELFAVKCAEWTDCRNGRGTCTRYVGTESETTIRVSLPQFSTDANAVLPWLEKCYQVSNVFEKGKWFVGIDRENGGGAWFVSATAPTLARAACIALIRAKRSTK